MNCALYLFLFTIFLPSFCLYNAKSSLLEEKNEQLRSAVENHFYTLVWRSQDGSRVSKQALNLFARWCKKPEQIHPDRTSACELLMNRGLTGPKVFAIGRELLGLDKENP
jgi:hypothetical protein